MKKQITWMCILLCSLLFIACEKAVIDNPDGKKKSDKERHRVTRVVRIHPTELSMETSDEPLLSKSSCTLSRVGGKQKEGKVKLYALNIYEQKAGSTVYEKYAYGLFSDADKMAIRMFEDNSYRIECLEVVEGDDHIYNKDGAYLAPFLHGADLPTKVTNKFVMSKKDNLGSIQKGETNLSETKTIRYPRVMKFYGTLEDINPKVSDALTIDMRRAVFGLLFKITPPEEGTLEISYLGWKLSRKSTQSVYNDGSIYAFSDIVEACKDGYQEVVPFGIKLTKADGTIVQEQKNLPLKRNVKTMVEIAIEGPKAHGLSFREENVAMTEEHVDWHVVK